MSVLNGIIGYFVSNENITNKIFKMCNGMKYGRDDD